MAALQSALQALGPVNFDDVPRSPEELDQYLADLYSNTQTIVESIPIAAPDEIQTRPRSKTTSSIASNASEMSTSSARSEPPPAHVASLQKEWGKPLKLKPSENPLGISVYKVPGKDGKGSWFARRSVHEGLGFDRFMRAFEKEFPTSLAVQGAPGEGNIRGIGAETRVEEIEAPHRGKMEVYRLTAQFPGPTTPRDFVTFLVTSSKAMKHHEEHDKVSELIPRHYMIVSKPCHHPATQPRNGFIRGQYESIEFIREVPRKLKTSTSQTNLSQLGHSHKHGHDMAHDILIRNAEKLRPNEQPLEAHHSTLREPSPSGRKRSHTIDAPDTLAHHRQSLDYDPEDNPVEWIMVTRSDPGGSVPRFLVERGTPTGICADAVKFLDWACQQDDDDQSPTTPSQPPKAFRRESFTSFENEERLAGIKEMDEASIQATNEPGSATPQSTSTMHTMAGHSSVTSRPDSPPSGTSSIMASVTGTLSAYAPQSVLDHFSGDNSKASAGLHSVADAGQENGGMRAVSPRPVDTDALSTISSTSWASADSHLTSGLGPEDQSVSNSLLSNTTSNQQAQDQHEKELAKLVQRKTAMDMKFAAQREKLFNQNDTATEKEKAATKKAEEKHEREIKKHEEKYQRELEKIQDRKVGRQEAEASRQR
jgi:Protein of unknown function (DUF3074)